MTRPIRILHVIDGLGGGGAERWLWDIVRRTSPHAFQHRIVTARPEDPSFVFGGRLRAAGAYRGQPPGMRLFSAMPLVLKRTLIAMPAPVVAARRNLYGLAAASVEYLRFRPDVIHAHVFHGLGIAAWLKAWSCRPIVYSPWCVPSQLRGSDNSWVIDEIRSLHPAADVIVTQPDCRAEWTALGVPPRTLAMFSGQVDLAAVRETIADSSHRRLVRSTFGIPPDAPVMLSVGRLTPAKGHHFAVEALPAVIRRVPAAHLILLGDGEERAALAERAGRLGVGDRVHLAGYVENPRPIYAAADLYLRPHLDEGENSSSQEAMAFGLPVAGFDTACGTDLLPRVGHGRRAAAGDVSSLASVIVEILSTADRGQTLGRRGADYAHRHLGIDAGLHLFEQIYRDLHERGGVADQEGAWSAGAAA